MRLKLCFRLNSVSVSLIKSRSSFYVNYFCFPEMKDPCVVVIAFESASSFFVIGRTCLRLVYSVEARFTALELVVPFP